MDPLPSPFLQSKLVSIGDRWYGHFVFAHPLLCLGHFDLMEVRHASPVSEVWLSSLLCIRQYVYIYI